MADLSRAWKKVGWRVGLAVVPLSRLLSLPPALDTRIITYLMPGV